MTSPFNTPDRILEREQWLRLVLELLASIHEGFRNAQLASPDYRLTDAFLSLTSDELNIVSKIHDVFTWLLDYCDTENDEAGLCTLCIRCVESVHC